MYVHAWSRWGRIIPALHVIRPVANLLSYVKMQTGGARPDDLLTIITLNEGRTVSRVGGQSGRVAS